MTEELLTSTVPPEMAGERLDAVLARLFPDFSRSRLQQWIKQGYVEVDGRLPKPRDKVLGGDTVTVRAQLSESETEVQAEEIALDVVYEDDDILVINKPVGLVVHPAAGNWAGTLQNALLHFDPDLKTIPRAGIVHRLDKDTSGLMVVARSLRAHKSLIDQLQARTVHREYHAIVNGVLTAGGTVDAAIGRHPRERKRMAVRDDGKPAVTHYRVVERFRSHSHVTCKLETGRTHQIRVHMSHLRHPIVGDVLYGGRAKLPKGASPEFIEILRGFKRQALHAARLGLIHPITGEEMHWQAPLPDDMQELLAALNKDREQHENGN